MNFNFHGKTKKKAMTFAEILISLGIMVVVLLAIAGAITGGLKALQKSNDLQEAGLIAKRTVETYKSRDYSEVLLHDTEPDIIYEDRFEIEVYVTEEKYPGTSKKYKKLTVKVSNSEEENNKINVSVMREAYLFPVIR